MDCRRSLSHDQSQHPEAKVKMELKNKNLSVIGLGQTGIAVANFLSRHGAHVTVTDSKSREQLLEPLKQLCADVKTRFQNPEPPSDTKAVVLSPGVDIHSSFLEDMRREGIEIISEIELANRFNSVPIIAITGTNGKSTCTSLITEIFERAEKPCMQEETLGLLLFLYWARVMPITEFLSFLAFKWKPHQAFTLSFPSFLI